MKKAVILFAILSFNMLRAGDSYHTYLLYKIYANSPSQLTTAFKNEKSLSIAHYQIPKGAVFCRMEDKLTRLTKVWVKVGVE